MNGRQLNVAFVTTGLSPGGAEQQLVRIVTHLDRSRFRPMVLSLLPPTHFEEELTRASVPVRSLDMARGRPSARAMAKAIRYLRAHRVDVVVAFQFHAFILARCIARLCGAQAVVSSIRTEKDVPLRERATALTDRMSAYTVVNGTRVAQALVTRGIVDATRIRVILNAIDDEPTTAVPAHTLAAARRALRASVGTPEEGLLWIHVARLVTEKDHGTMLDAARDVAAAHPSMRLILVGDGPLRGEIEAGIARLGLGEQVRLLGHRSDVPALLRCADAFVLSSEREGSPNALLEAMAAGVPCISTDVGGVTDLIPSSAEGRVVPSRDPTALAAAMKALTVLSEPERRHLGARGQAHVLGRHGLSGIVEQWQSIIAAAVVRP